MVKSRLRLLSVGAAQRHPHRRAFVATQQAGDLIVAGVVGWQIIERGVVDFEQYIALFQPRPFRRTVADNRLESRRAVTDRDQYADPNGFAGDMGIIGLRYLPVRGKGCMGL